MYEITNRQQAPYASICYIRCEWADGGATRASGVIIGYNDVLTALHVVYDATRGGWAKSITISPAADTSPFFSTVPYGSYSDVGPPNGLAANWDLDGDGLLTEQESAGDLALLGLRSRIGDATGWLPVAQVPTDLNGLMVGYPARGTGMMAESVFADASSVASVYDIGSVLGPGASGGPLLYTSGGVTSVVGVLSAGSDSESTFAGLYSASTWSWLHSAMAANDSLLGYPPGSSPDGAVFTGTNFPDDMTGTSGPDTFNGRAGNDSFDGAAGIDTALFGGLRSSYTVTVVSDGIRVQDSVSGRDGIDTLHNVERIKFADYNVAFDIAGHAGAAYRLYQAAFQRAPDIGGLGFHINDLDNGVYIGSVAAHFIWSPEFTNTYGALDNEHFVRQLYLNVLHREPDAGGLAYHVHNLETTHQRSDVLVGFSESPENQANVIGAIQDGMVYTQ